MTDTPKPLGGPPVSYERSNAVLRRMAERAESAAGRPTTYSPDLVAAILEDVVNEGMMLSRALEKHGVPDSTFYWWRSTHPELMESVIYARAAGSDTLIKNALRELDEANQQFEVNKAAQKLRFAQWYAERMAPAEYSDVASREYVRRGSTLRELLDLVKDRQDRLSDMQSDGEPGQVIEGKAHSDADDAEIIEGDAD